jgi:hypothetical protein
MAAPGRLVVCHDIWVQAKNPPQAGDTPVCVLRFGNENRPDSQMIRKNASQAALPPEIESFPLEIMADLGYLLDNKTE